MPYKISKKGDQFCVVATDTGKEVHCHPTMAKAKDQMAALYANVKDAKESMIFEDADYEVRGPNKQNQFCVYQGQYSADPVSCHPTQLAAITEMNRLNNLEEDQDAFTGTDDDIKEAMNRSGLAMEGRARESVLDGQEAVFHDDTLRAEVTLVRPGISQNGRNWKSSALKRAVESGFWNGTRMFMDHQDPRKPPFKRPLTDLLSGVESARIAPEDGRVVGDVQFFNEDFYNFAKRAKNYMGVSLDVRFKGSKVRQPDGRVQEEVDELVQNNSVDWVAFPAAGGAIDRFLSAQESEDTVDWENITPEMIKEHAPDLYSRIQESVQEPADVGNKPPAKGRASAQSPADLKVFVDQRIQEARQSWEDEARTKASVARQISEKVNAAALNAQAKKQLIAKFDGASEYEETRVQESISEMQELLKSVGGPRVIGMGPSQGDGSNLSKEEKAVALKSAAPTMSAVESVLMGSFDPATDRAQEGQK